MRIANFFLLSSLLLGSPFLSAQGAAKLDSRVFVVEDHGTGVTCRSASSGDTRRFQNVRPADLHVIYGSEKGIRPHAGLDIILRATSQLEANPAAKAAFIRAAQNWERLISSSVTVYIDVDYGTTFFGEPFGSANTLGATGTDDRGPFPISQYRSLMVARAGNAQETALYSALGNTIPTDIGSATSMGGPSPLMRAIGLLPAVAASSDDAPRIGFNSSFSFDLNPDDGISSSQTDFDAVATHEMGHALGFSSFVGERELDNSFPIAPSAWDVFRLRPGTGAANFGSATRILLAGGDQRMFTGSSEIPLSTGRGDGSGGDGEQASHWKDDGISGVYIGLMDPNIGRGRRGVLTDADKLAIDLMGWSLAAASGSGPFDFVAVVPCRVHDTRGTTRLLSGQTRSFTMVGGVCGVPSTARAVSINVTVTNNATGYLSLWPAGRPQPVVSTINYQAGGQYALANAAIVPLGTAGAINVFAEGNSDVILDVNGYFE